MQHRLSLKLPPNLSRIIKERKSDAGFYKPYKGHKDNIKSGLDTRVCLDISQFKYGLLSNCMNTSILLQVLKLSDSSCKVGPSVDNSLTM